MSAGLFGIATVDAGGQGLTAAQRMHQILRDEIIHLHRRPGEPISEKDMAANFGISRTPIREALLRLAEEGLVDIVPKSGTSVARIPVGLLPEALVARAALEDVTVRAAAERARGSDIASLRAVLELQREHESSGDEDQFYAADDAMHQLIARAADYPGLWAIIVHVKVQVDRYRRLTMAQPERMVRVLQEHTVIVDAIADHDPAAAAAAMRHHLDGLSAEDVQAIRDHNPDYFVGDIEAAYAKWGSGSAALQEPAGPVRRRDAGRS